MNTTIEPTPEPGEYVLVPRYIWSAIMKDMSQNYPEYHQQIGTAVAPKGLSMATVK